MSWGTKEPTGFPGEHPVSSPGMRARGEHPASAPSSARARTTYFPVFSSVIEKELIESTAHDIKRLTEVLQPGESLRVERHPYHPGKNLFTVTTNGFD